MSEWVKKRFWKEALAVEAGGQWGVELDGRRLKTPAKLDLVVPTKALAHLIALEWNAVDAVIDPETMPFTRLANAAADRMEAKSDDVIAMLSGFSETDLLCYRAGFPDALVDRQGAVWDPLLRWAKTEHDVALVTTTGVIPVPQPATSLAAVTAWFARHDAFELMALHEFVTLLGSAVMAMAVADGHLNIQDAWAASRVDEIWQAETWGEDEVAEAEAALKFDAFTRAHEFWSALKS